MSETAKHADPEWRGDVLQVKTTRCVGCGLDLALLLKAKKQVIYGGHLCAYSRGDMVTAGWCGSCRNTFVAPPARKNCIGCYGFWDAKKHGGIVELHEDE